MMAIKKTWEEFTIGHELKIAGQNSHNPGGGKCKPAHCQYKTRVHLVKLSTHTPEGFSPCTKDRRKNCHRENPRIHTKWRSPATWMDNLGNSYSLGHLTAESQEMNSEILDTDLGHRRSQRMLTF